jgi:hypothetical protein
MGAASRSAAVGGWFGCPLAAEGDGDDVEVQEWGKRLGDARRSGKLYKGTRTLGLGGGSYEFLS